MTESAESFLNFDDTDENENNVVDSTETSKKEYLEEEEDDDDEFDYSEEEDDDDEFDIDSIFNSVTSVIELGEGIHTNVRLVEIDIEKRKNNAGKVIQLQTFLTFKKYGDDGAVLGVKEVSFFMLNYTKQTLVNSLITYLTHLKSILKVYLPEDRVAKFDPIRALLKITGDVAEADFQEDVFKANHLPNSKTVKTLEEIIKKMFFVLMKDSYGEESKFVKLKLEESMDGKHIQIPYFNKFIECAEVSDEDSELLDN